MKTINEVLSFNLKRLRGDQSQAKLAEIAGIPVRSYQYMEDGNLPRRDNLEAVAKALGVHETKLFLDPDITLPPNPVSELVALLPTLNQTQIRMLLEGARALAPSVKISADRNDKKNA